MSIFYGLTNKAKSDNLIIGKVGVHSLVWAGQMSRWNELESLWIFLVEKFLEWLLSEVKKRAKATSRDLSGKLLMRWYWWELCIWKRRGNNGRNYYQYIIIINLASAIHSSVFWSAWPSTPGSGFANWSLWKFLGEHTCNFIKPWESRS